MSRFAHILEVFSILLYDPSIQIKNLVLNMNKQKRGMLLFIMLDYHVHVLSHGEYEYQRDWLNSFLDQACRKGIKEIGFSEHDEFFQKVDLAIYQSLKIERQSDITLKLGIEVDYIPGLEIDLKKLVNRSELDYSIGSIHFIDGWAFDHPDHKQGFSDFDIDEVYARYANLLVTMVNSGLFDVVGHLDLVKIWGHRPRKKEAAYYFEPVLLAIQKSKMAVEINSAGLRKPVQEMYPAADLLALMFAKNIPITFGSDAHHPEQVGEGLREAYQMARRAGYKSQVAFYQHAQTARLIESK